MESKYTIEQIEEAQAQLNRIQQILISSNREDKETGKMFLAIFEAGKIAEWAEQKEKQSRIDAFVEKHCIGFEDRKQKFYEKWKDSVMFGIDLELFKKDIDEL